MRFRDREDAGRQLAKRLAVYRSEEPLVLGLPRGGVPVAYEVATALDAPLDIWIVRKVGAPWQPELGVGAVAENGSVYLNAELISEVGASDADIERIVQQKSAEVAQRVQLFRHGGAPPDVRGRTLILVDDGIATGGTVHAALQSLRAAGAGRIVLATPVAANQTLEELQALVDDIVCVHPTDALYAIGAWYEDFHQVPDEDVIALLERGRTRAAATSEEIDIDVGTGVVSGTLNRPQGAKGLVIFAHGSGSSRFSPRNRRVAAVLNEAGLATLLFDLLTREEEEVDEYTAELRFDIDLLARRLLEVTDWALASRRTRELGLGYFGSSTGAAAALVAAAERPSDIHAVVSRGGRPDLAYDDLARVQAPTLLLVGGEDSVVIDLNQRALQQLHCTKKLVIIPGATHLFEEPGTLDDVARLASQWFQGTLLEGRAPTLAATEAHPH